MNKRVHQIAKERGLPSKDLLERLRAAGVDVKAASSNVDEDVALKVLGNGASASGAAKPAAVQAAPGSAEVPDAGAAPSTAGPSGPAPGHGRT